jgi:hypothetical protein
MNNYEAIQKINNGELCINDLSPDERVEVMRVSARITSNTNEAKKHKAWCKQQSVTKKDKPFVPRSAWR